MVENENYKSYTANNGTELRFPKGIFLLPLGFQQGRAASLLAHDFPPESLGQHRTMSSCQIMRCCPSVIPLTFRHIPNRI